MIGYDDVVPLLSAACPSYAGSPEAERVDEADGPYVAMGCIVAHLVRVLATGRTECMPAVFSVVERVLLEGDKEARRLLTRGFLRDLMSPDSYGDSTLEPRDFVAWLGPEARKDPSVRMVTGTRRGSEPPRS